MWQVKQMFVPFNYDDDYYLIRVEDFEVFKKQFEKIDNDYLTHNNDELWIEQVDNLLTHFSNTRLGGKKYCVVLEDDYEWLEG